MTYFKSAKTPYWLMNKCIANQLPRKKKKAFKKMCLYSCDTIEIAKKASAKASDILDL